MSRTAPHVVIAANRGPLSFGERGGTLRAGAGVGSLAATLRKVVDRLSARVTWLAATATDGDRAAAAAGAMPDLPFGFEFVPVDRPTYASYYEEVANRVLWPACHGLWNEPDVAASRDELVHWQRFQRVNRAFAAAIARAAPPAAVASVHDFHLATVPRHLRCLAPDVPVAHFTHTPAAGAGALGRLPARIARELVGGMLGADLVAFHTGAWAAEFVDACAWLGYATDSGSVAVDDRRVAVGAYPLPLDAERVLERAGGPAAREWAGRIASRPGPLVVKVDRIDPAKNIVRALEAFGRVLDRRADVRSARLLACVFGTRQSMPEYRRHEERIRSTAARVEERHTGAVELLVGDDYGRALGALRRYDVLLVNPIRDGMNLVAKEGPLVNERDGVLVLSRTAGAFAELGGDAVPIDDPLDVEQTAAALERALDMGADERVARAARLRAQVSDGAPDRWLLAQLEHLSVGTAA